MHGRDSCQLFDLDDGINLQSFHSGQVYRGTVKGERQLVNVRSGGHFRFKVKVKMFKEPLLPQCYVANYFIYHLSLFNSEKAAKYLASGQQWTTVRDGDFSYE